MRSADFFIATEVMYAREDIDAMVLLEDGDYMDFICTHLRGSLLGEDAIGRPVVFSARVGWDRGRD